VIDLYVVSAVRLHREGLMAMLADCRSIRMVGAGSPDELSSSHAVDVYVVDVYSPEGLSAITRVTRELATSVVAYGVEETEREVVAAVEAGARGLVLADDGVGDLVETIELAARGEVRLSPRIAGILTRRLASLAAGRDDPLPVESKLTARELQIICLVDEGLSNKQIAQVLQIQVPTVKNHVHSILEKLNVSRRAEAAARMRSAFRDRRIDDVAVISATGGRDRSDDLKLVSSQSRT
jgi:two-component system, NarL family, nitrate/nitrite response regulator NarL